MNNKHIRLLAWLLVPVFIVLSIVNAAKLINANGCVDLRCRTVGARLSHTPWSPYFYKWAAKDGEYFLDPNDKPNRKVNGNVVTPAVFRLLYRLSAFRYDYIKSVWAVLQYLFLFGSVLLLSERRSAADKNNTRAFIIIVLAYLYSNVWFYNIERGQVYTLYLFLFSLIYRLYLTGGNYGMFVCGFVNVLAVFIRPLIAVFLIAGVVKPDRKYIAGSICGALAGGLLFVWPVTVQWRDYFSAMKMYSIEMNAAPADDAAGSNIPAVVEGQSNLQKAGSFSCGGLTTVQYYLAAKGIKSGSFILAFFFCLAAAASYVLWRKTGPSLKETDHIFLFAFFLYMLAELFIIGYRGGYNQVEWVFGIFLICSSRQLPRLFIAAILLAVLLENIPLHVIPYQFEMAEIILMAILFYQAAGISYPANRQLQKSS